MNSTNYLEDLVLNTFLASGTTYIGLSTTVPTLSGTNFTEPTGTYARQSVTWSASQHSGTSGYVINTNTVQFPEPNYDWGSLQYCGIFTASSGGNIMFISPQTGTIQINDIIRYPSGSLNISLN